MGEKLRWKIVYLLNRLPGQCWADLVTWALDGRRRDAGDPVLPLRPITGACRKDFEANGCCWCGKLATDQIRAVQRG